MVLGKGFNKQDPSSIKMGLQGTSQSLSKTRSAGGYRKQGKRGGNNNYRHQWGRVGRQWKLVHLKPRKSTADQVCEREPGRCESRQKKGRRGSSLENGR
jgi:hypothetical protein